MTLSQICRPLRSTHYSIAFFSAVIDDSSLACLTNYLIIFLCSACLEVFAPQLLLQDSLLSASFDQFQTQDYLFESIKLAKIHVSQELKDSCLLKQPIVPFSKESQLDYLPPHLLRLSLHSLTGAFFKAQLIKELHLSVFILWSSSCIYSSLIYHR